MASFTHTDHARSALLRLGAALQQADYSFVTISNPSHRRVNNRAGNETASDLRGIFGWSRRFRRELPGEPLLSLMYEAGIVEEDGELCRSLLRASTLDGRLYFHSAFPTAQQDAVFFGPDTYRYVQVLHGALADMTSMTRMANVANISGAAGAAGVTDAAGHAPLRAIDIGCGAGPGAITIAALLPQAEVWAVDINPAALALTRINLALAGMPDVRVAHSDLLHDVEGDFDLIVSNPPFMMDDRQRTYCHGGGELGEGLSLAIVRAALDRLKPGGRLVLYTCVAIIEGSDPFQVQVAAMVAAVGGQLHYREIDPDVFGGELGADEHQHTDRIAAIAMVARLPASR